MDNVVFYKWLVYVSQLLLLCVGIGFIIIGSLFLTIFKHDFQFTEFFSIQTASIVFISIGATLAILVFIGIILTKCDNIVIVKYVQIIFLLITLLSTLLFGIIGFIYIGSSRLKNSTTNELTDTFNEYNEADRHNLNTREIDWLQSNFECCGLRSINDWESKNITPFETPLSENHINELQAMNRLTFDLPDSCCIQRTENCGKEFPNRANIFSDSCLDKFNRVLIQDLNMFFGVAIIIASINLIPVILMCYAINKYTGAYSKINSN